MKNSHLIADHTESPDPFEDLLVFVNGHDGDRKMPMHVASTLENDALREGWPVGKFIGSESKLMEHFDISRDALREAVRIVETHGSMRMLRGCKGGLHVIQPSLDQAAAALATYLRACGCDDTELADTAAIVAPLFTRLGDSPIAQLLQRTLALLAGGTAEHAPEAQETIRATTIAARIVQGSAPIPLQGMVLGSEAKLCERFNCCRSTIRQALRILGDLEMLQVRRGRGGGFSLKRPTSNGIIRQLFALLASRQQKLTHTVSAVWELNLANLQLAMRRLDMLDESTLAERCDALAASFAQASEPKRWARLQQSISEIAGNTMIATLQRSLIVYQARLGSPLVAYESIDSELRSVETDIVQALRHRDHVEAERLQRNAQTLLSRLLLSDLTKPYANCQCAITS